MLHLMMFCVIITEIFMSWSSISVKMFLVDSVC
jgi:hypothetical protein